VAAIAKGYDEKGNCAETAIDERITYEVNKESGNKGFFYYGTKVGATVRVLINIKGIPGKETYIAHLLDANKNPVSIPINFQLDQKLLPKPNMPYPFGFVFHNVKNVDIDELRFEITGQKIEGTSDFIAHTHMSFELPKWVLTFVTFIVFCVSLSSKFSSGNKHIIAAGADFSIALVIWALPWMSTACFAWIYAIIVPVCAMVVTFIICRWINNRSFFANVEYSIDDLVTGKPSEMLADLQQKSSEIQKRLSLLGKLDIVIPCFVWILSTVYMFVILNTDKIYETFEVVRNFS
jgi:hypothetical protein